jgi:hypothetical protein
VTLHLLVQLSPSFICCAQDVLGATFFNDSQYFQVPGSSVCYDVPQTTLRDGSDVIFENYLVGVTPVCKFDSSDSTVSSFNVLNAYSFPDSFDTGFGPTLTVLFIVALAIYFATSSDSGSLIVDHLSCNGRKKHHWLQRLFWAVTEGAVATALLGAGGSNALQALQAASIISGLPFCFFLMYITQSIYLMCQRATETEEMEYHINHSAPEFATPVYGGIFNMGELICSLGQVHPARVEKGMHRPSQLHIYEFIKGVFIPFYSLYEILAVAHPKTPNSNIATAGLYGFLYLTWISLFITYGPVPGILAFAWTAFFVTGFVLTGIRGEFRARYNLRSNILGDWVSSTFIWPQVLMQMREHMINGGEPKDEDA